MSQQNRTLWDDLVELGREILDKLDELLNPEKKRREPARMPVPVRTGADNDPYDEQA